MPDASGPWLRPVRGTSEGAPDKYFPQGGSTDPLHDSVTGLPPRRMSPDVSASAFWPIDRYVDLERADSRTKVDALGNIIRVRSDQISGRDEVAFNPLFRYLNDPALNETAFDLLWPLVQYRRSENNERLQVIPLFWFNRFKHADGRDDLDVFIFPFIFFGEESFPADMRDVDRLFWHDRNHDNRLDREELRLLPGKDFEDIDSDRDGYISRDEAVARLAKPARTESYFAAVPFGGTLRGFLLNDWLEFYLFPIFLHTRQDKFESWYLPWPIIHWGSGGGRSSFHILPFYATDVTREQVRDEATGEMVDGEIRSERRSVLWPIIQWQNIYGEVNVSDDPRHPRFERQNIFHSEMVFPFWNRLRTRNRTTTSILWPLFNVQEDKEREYVSIDAPWPIFRYASGIGEQELRIWPLFHQYRKVGTDGSEEYLLNLLWPIIWYEQQRTYGRVETSFKIIPIFWNTTIDHLDPADGSVIGHEQVTKLWPVFGYVRERDGTERVEFLSPLPDARVPDFENNWAVFWRLFYWERSGDGRREKWNALGPLIRYERDETSEKFDFFPLVQHRSGWTKGPYPVHTS
ncbi:MAG: hypothetical protein AB7K09_19680, partial [Planctomycetota bacterium]